MSAPKSHPATEDMSNIDFDSHPATEDMSNIGFDSHPATEGEGVSEADERGPQTGKQTETGDMGRRAGPGA